ncbi:MAG: GNAT family N-acetyltransferase [Actinobacteria bacterium]|nr:GNAT family N-acetyltransferase [Actinomycetota bacterium]
METTIKHVTSEHVVTVALLHKENISSGFISSLGPTFIKQLYRGIAGCESAFCLVALEEDRVLGFIAGAESVGKLYKSVLLKRGLLMSACLVRFVFSLRTISKIFQTLLYPSRTSQEYPPAEILSVAVAPDARRMGVGHKLMHAALDEFKRRGIGEVKVAVAAANKPANQYYLKEGFQKAGAYDSHGVQTNIYVRQLADGCL